MREELRPEGGVLDGDLAELPGLEGLAAQDERARSGKATRRIGPEIRVWGGAELLGEGVLEDSYSLRTGRVDFSVQGRRLGVGCSALLRRGGGVEANVGVEGERGEGGGEDNGAISGEESAPGEALRPHVVKEGIDGETVESSRTSEAS